MKKFISLLIILLLITPLIGCKESKQEVEKLGIILAEGFDLTPDGKYQYTAQILNTQANPTSKSKDTTEEESSEVVVFSAIGDTPYSATSNLGESYGKSLFFGHSRYIVIGEKLARSGLGLLTDTVFRIRTSRPDILLLITKGKASEIVKASVPNEKIPSNEIENLQRFQKSKGFSPMTSNLEFANSLLNESGTSILGFITLRNDYGTDNVLDFSGSAVFKKDKLAGYMNINETRGVQWIKGKVQGGVITSYLPDNNLVSFFSIDSKSKIKPKLNGDSLYIDVDIQVLGNVIEMSAPLNPMKNHKDMDKLNQLLSKAVKDEATLAINAAQKKFKADVFDFGKTVSEDYPNFWDKNKNDWSSIFSKIKININVSSSVKRPGVISKPIK